MPHAELVLDDFCHTLGALMQEYCLQDDDVGFAAYRVLHPLERRVSLKVSTIEGSVEAALARATGRIRADLRRIRDEKKVEVAACA